jgi:hypothetical protein
MNAATVAAMGSGVKPPALGGLSLELEASLEEDETIARRIPLRLRHLD